ncbi:Protein fem-1-like protein [Colletotrichum truncatum]|uniref:Protein fem-1-like protein n=1 Tax=Colletotrichum truncatum TaxID=5467 RepID=A0ACC3Z8A2_COLTU|nr:Protein fem-1-like protein [Colletotrichum truncatum]KAF6789146.1 Protein fem-1-like protein [Colletotrichum truncatum]
MFVAALKQDSTIIRELSQYPRLVDRHEKVPGLLSECVKQNDLGNVRFLLSEGEDVNEDNSHVRYGRSPLQEAVEEGNLELVELLVKAGANVNTPAAKYGGATALQLAAIKGRLGIARELRELGANIDAPGAEEHGRTALEGAAEHGRIDMVQYLLSEGAQTTGPGQLQYLRAIRYAQDSGQMVVVDLLKGHREWTADDDTLWEELFASSYNNLERYEARAGELVTDQDDGELDTDITSHKGFSHGEESSGDDEADDISSDHPVHSHTDDNGANSNVCLEDLGLAAIEDLEMITDDFMAFMDTGLAE